MTRRAATTHGYLPRWTFTWGNSVGQHDAVRLLGKCNADRGQQGNNVYVVDTYLEDELLPTAAHAKLVNYDPFLVDRVLYCKRATGAAPTFVMVKSYLVSDLFHVVDVLNGFAPPPNDNLDAFPPTAWPTGTGGGGGAAP